MGVPSSRKVTVPPSGAEPEAVTAAVSVSDWPTTSVAWLAVRTMFVGALIAMVAGAPVLTPLLAVKPKVLTPA